MHDLYAIAEFTADGSRLTGMIVGRTREEHPRYNIQVERQIHKDVPADKITIVRGEQRALSCVGYA